MKVFSVVLVCCLVASSQASLLDDIGQFFKQAGQGVVDTGKAVGSTLLDQLKQTGMTLLSSAVGELVNQLNEVGQTSKRDLSSVLQEMAPVVTKLQSMMKNHTDAQKLLFGLTLNELKKVAEQMAIVNNRPLNDIFKEIDLIVAGHSQLADLLLDDLKGKVNTLTTPKRSLVDNLGQVGSSLADTFAPQINSLKSIVSSVGEALKQAAAGLFTSLTQSVQNLGSKLAPHSSAISDSGHAIAQEGQNALDALKSAVGDIFQQTMSNMKPHLDNIVQHGKQALGEAAGQVATNLLIHSLTGN